MARKNTSDDVFSAVDEVGYIRDVDGGASTTTDASAAADQAVLSVADETGFEVDDLVRIGSGDELEVGKIASTSAGQITLDSNLAFTHASGVNVVEQEKVDMGHVAEGGVTHDMSEDTFELNAATSATPLVVKTVSVDQTFGWPSLMWSMENVAVSAGVPESEVSGSETEADPTIVDYISDHFNSLKNATLYMAGTLEDGRTIEIHGHNVKFDLNRSSSFARNAGSELPVSGNVKSTRFMLWAA